MEFQESSKSYTPRYLNEQQVAEITGISRSSLQQHRWRGTGIPYTKFGRSVRYLEREVLAHMERGRVETDQSD